MQEFCRRCEAMTDHQHLHDTAHGIPETHMSGSERFVCTVCGLTTSASDGVGTFKFVLDAPDGGRA